MEDVTEQTATHTPLATLSPDDLAAFTREQEAAYAELAARGLRLDLTRGKPATDQLDLSNGLLSLPEGVTDAAGTDTRNYGGLEGIRELREMFAQLLWVEPEQVVAGGNSSLTMMKDVLVDLLLFGGVDSPAPVGPGGGRPLRVPRPGLRPALHPAREPGHRDGHRADARRRA